MPDPQKPGCLGTILQLFGSSPQPKTTVKIQKEETNLPELAEVQKEEVLPYRIRDDFLSSAELSFYHILQQAVGDWAVVCPKISLDDLFYAKSGDRGSNQTYTNKIDRKHVDFLLCHPKTMRPWLGIELDDASHQKSSRQERDRFVEKVFATANLPLFRQAVRSTYNVHELAAILRQQAGVNKIEQPSVVETWKPKPLTDEVTTPVGNSQAFESTASFPSQPDKSTPECPQCGEPMVLRTVQKEGPHKGNRFWGCKDYPRCRGMRPYGGT